VVRARFAPQEKGGFVVDVEWAAVEEEARV
jgi:hypothetical protein